MSYKKPINIVYGENHHVTCDWEESYIGCVLDDRERNWHDDSDGYCLVWDEASQSVIELPTWTTRGAGPFCQAIIDATEETKAKVAAWHRERRIQSILHDSEVAAKIPALGKRVTVVKGVKVPIGLTGEVFWAKMVNYDPYKRSYNDELRIGIEEDNGNRVFIMAHNCEVINPEQYIKTRQQAEQEVR